jgi:hypothetical protein
MGPEVSTRRSETYQRRIFRNVLKADRCAAYAIKVTANAHT